MIQAAFNNGNMSLIIKDLYHNKGQIKSNILEVVHWIKKLFNFYLN